MKKNRYETEIIEMSKAGLLLSITIVSSLITSTWSPIPKIPFFNARPDFWFGFAFLSLLFLNKKYSILFVIALPFAMIPSELSSYPYGFADYALELILPISAMAFMIYKPKKKSVKIIWGSFVFVLYFSLRLICMSAAGVYFYGTTWKVAILYNVWNVLIDLLFSLPIFYLGYFKMLNIWKN